MRQKNEPPARKPITSFARWLAKRGLRPYQYARTLGCDKQAICALAGVRSSRVPRSFMTSTLERVSADTGIPATRLYAEAMDALEHEPRLPRRYTRRGDGAADRASSGDPATSGRLAD